MSSLPDPVTQDINSPTAPMMGGAGAKEKEAVGVALANEFPYAAGAEVELPKEVASAGVTARPPTVPIPQPVSQWVKPAGSSAPVAPPTTGIITLPITDAERLEGYKKDSTSSWRWLSVWCDRLIKKIWFRRK